MPAPPPFTLQAESQTSKWTDRDWLEQPNASSCEVIHEERRSEVEPDDDKGKIAGTSNELR
jgi:hypothetical protein